MRKNLWIAVVFAVSVFVFAACSGASDNNTQPDESMGGDVQALTVTATNYQFDKEKYEVKAGQPVKITLVSKDGVHGLGIDEFDVNIQKNGEATFMPEKPGEYRIYCSIPCGTGHADMVSTLVVK